MSTPILRSGSCTRIFQDSDEEDLPTGDDERLPPPPSPPCTCGKNLELPPTPPLGRDVAHSGGKSGKADFILVNLLVRLAIYRQPIIAIIA